MALASEHGWLLLIDDRRAHDFSRGPLGLSVVDSPPFAVFLYDQERIGHQEAVSALQHSGCGRRLVRRALIDLESLRRKKERR
jgi:hypothetical protein